MPSMNDCFKLLRLERWSESVTAEVKLEFDVRWLLLDLKGTELGVLRSPLLGSVSTLYWSTGIIWYSAGEVAELSVGKKLPSTEEEK